MDSWERFNGTSLPDKEAFCSKLNLEDITDKDYARAQKVWKVFQIKNLGEYYDLYVQSDTLLLANPLFENFRDKCIEIYGLDPINCFKWVEDISEFNERFIKNYDENSDKRYFLEVDDEYLKNLFNSHKDLPFLTKKKKMRNSQKTRL